MTDTPVHIPLLQSLRQAESEIRRRYHARYDEMTGPPRQDILCDTECRRLLRLRDMARIFIGEAEALGIDVFEHDVHTNDSLSTPAFMELLRQPGAIEEFHDFAWQELEDLRLADAIRLVASHIRDEHVPDTPRQHRSFRWEPAPVFTLEERMQDAIDMLLYRVHAAHRNDDNAEERKYTDLAQTLQMLQHLVRETGAEMKEPGADMMNGTGPVSFGCRRKEQQRPRRPNDFRLDRLVTWLEESGQQDFLELAQDLRNLDSALYKQHYGSTGLGI